MRDGKRPERTVYEMTNDGAREMVDWMTDLIGAPIKEYPPSWPGSPSCRHSTPTRRWPRCASGGGAHREAGRPEGWHGGGQQGGPPAALELEVEYEEALLAAELNFVRALIEDIEAGVLEGLEMWQTFHVEGATPPEGVTFTFKPPPE